MSDRKGIFAGDDPFAITRAWMAEAQDSEPGDSNAVALATVDENGLPNLRTVLVKAIEDDAIVFFTNYESRKGREIEAQPKVAMNFHWKTLARQVRIRGTVERESPEKSDAYYRSRPLGSRIGAWASKQSRPLASRAALLAEVAKAQLAHGLNPARPDYWGGYRVLPLEFEFWAAGEFRLHDRFRWRRAGPGAPWDIQRLNP